MLCKMAVERDHIHAVRGKQGCICYSGQMVRIHENLEARLKAETVLAQKAAVTVSELDPVSFFTMSTLSTIFLDGSEKFAKRFPTSRAISSLGARESL